MHVRFLLFRRKKKATHVHMYYNCIVCFIVCNVLFMWFGFVEWYLIMQVGYWLNEFIIKKFQLIIRYVSLSFNVSKMNWGVFLSICIYIYIYRKHIQCICFLLEHVYFIKLFLGYLLTLIVDILWFYNLKIYISQFPNC